MGAALEVAILLVASVGLAVSAVAGSNVGIAAASCLVFLVGYSQGRRHATEDKGE